MDIKYTYLLIKIEKGMRSSHKHSITILPLPWLTRQSTPSSQQQQHAHRKLSISIKDKNSILGKKGMESSMSKSLTYNQGSNGIFTSILANKILDSLATHLKKLILCFQHWIMEAISE